MMHTGGTDVQKADMGNVINDTHILNYKSIYYKSIKVF